MPRAGGFAIAYGKSIICLGGTAPGGDCGSRGSRETWKYSTETTAWTQLASAPKDNVGEGYLFLDGSTIRDASDPDLNFSINENKWTRDPLRQKLPNHYSGPNPVTMSVPY